MLKNPYKLLIILKNLPKYKKIMLSIYVNNYLLPYKINLKIIICKV